jgi:putative peptide zinc metalloprotease protein
MATFLKPYKLEIISTMLAALAAGSMIGWPLFRLCKNLKKRGRLPDMKPIRLTIVASILAGLLLAFFLVPVPVTRVREKGLIQIAPGEFVQIPVEVPGTLEKIFVKEGQEVKRGTILAEFSSLDLKMDEDQARAQYTSASQQIQAYQGLSTTVSKPEDKAQIQEALNTAQADQRSAQVKLQQIDERKKKLILVAPRDGTVMGLPKIDEIGKKWDKDQTAPFCTVGDPKKLRILVPVTTADYDLVRVDYDKRTKLGEAVPVTIRVIGRDSQTWSGKLKHFPKSEAREVPLALTNKGGGPLATKPSPNPNQHIPQTQVYLLGIEIDNPDSAICPGTLAQVKIHCEYKSCAWGVWRWLSQTFDLGLL